MSDDQNFGFGKFVPGFDFLQNLAKGAAPALPQMPSLSSWVAPTLNVEELDKRISELKAVHFWLDQNSKALGATVQALEVQKMTLATLKGMNFNMAELASAMQLKPAEPKPAADQKAPAKAADAPKVNAADGAVTPDKDKPKNSQGQANAAGVVDPVQWWGALTQQFQQIAASAMQDARQNPAAAARTLAEGTAQTTLKAASDMAGALTGDKAARPRKPAARKTARKSPPRGR